MEEAEPSSAKTTYTRWRRSRRKKSDTRSSESFLGLLWSEFPVTDADAIEHDDKGRVIQSKDDLKKIKAILIHEITNPADAPVLQAKGQRTRLGTHLLNTSTLINKEFLELSSADVPHSMETDTTNETHDFLNPNLVDIFNDCKCCIVSKRPSKYCQDCRIDHSNNQLSEGRKIERYWIRKQNEALNGCQICPLSQWVKDIEEKLRSPETEEDHYMDEEAWSYF